MSEHHIIPVWFFVGCMFVVYGVLILGSGIAEWSHPPSTVLSQLHAPVWWGAIMTVLGAVYCYYFWPSKGER